MSSWPPFEAGNSASLAHGARSPRRVAPLAEQIERQARASESWPSYLDTPEYGPAVASWSWSEAVCRLLREYLAELDIAAMLTEQTSEDLDEQRLKGGRTRRRTTSQRHHSALEMSRRWESIAAGRRKDIGLDPLSRAKLSKDVAIGTAVAGGLERLQETGRALVEKYGRPALSAAETAVADQSTQEHPGARNDASTSDTGGSNGEQD